MNERRMPQVERGWQLFDRDGHRMGVVDAVFADYLLVRSGGVLPVDLYVPTDAIVTALDGRVLVRGSSHDAYARWHRPLKRAPHD